MKTEIDYTEDLETLNKFIQKFEERYLSVLGFTISQVAKPMDYIKRGAIIHYSLPKPKIVETKYLRDINGFSRISLESSINPNGITDINDIARTYTISLEVQCQRRNKYGRYWFDDVLFTFYGYGRTIDEIMDKFHKFYLEKLI